MLKPHADRVIIKPDPAEKVSEGGIHLLAPRADGKAAAPRTGTVVAVGPGRWSKDGSTRVPVSVRPGQRVWFSPVFDGVELKKAGMTVLGKDELMCRDSDILMVEGEG